MSCYDEWAAVEAAEEGSDEHLEALGRYLWCYRSILDGRHGHALAQDEKLYQFAKQLQEFSDALFGRLKIPPRPDCGLRSLEIRKELFSNPETAMLFSQSIAKAFEKAGLKLKDDETFACLICVQKKPTYISEVISTSSLASKSQQLAPMDHIMEPAIMKQALDVLEREKIKYPG